MTVEILNTDLLVAQLQPLFMPRCATHPGTMKRVESEAEAAQVFGYRVRYCKNPKVEFYQRPQIDGACVVDGSEYRAELITGEQFGCVLHEPVA